MQCLVVWTVWTGGPDETPPAQGQEWALPALSRVSGLALLGYGMGCWSVLAVRWDDERQPQQASPAGPVAEPIHATLSEEVRIGCSAQTVCEVLNPWVSLQCVKWLTCPAGQLGVSGRVDRRGGRCRHIHRHHPGAARVELTTGSLSGSKGIYLQLNTASDIVPVRCPARSSIQSVKPSRPAR
jgi:hypothetical protein